MKYRSLKSTQFFFSILALFSLCLYILGVANYLSTTEPNTCDLTYMFEYPEYVRIKLDDEVEEKYPQFSLYGYGEGYSAEKLRQLKYSGIPVLFIPGNAGSHGQVRSLASVSLRMSLKRRTPFHFDYFTISFAEDLSALSGGVIQKQTDFVSICIQRVLSLYNGNIDQIVIIGHSMGGVVAKAALLRDQSSNTSLASVLINLASPYVPFVAFDKTFASYYDNINNHARQINRMGTTVISIGGGTRDHMVTTSQIIDPNADLNVLSTAIPNVWKPLDHLSILWCKQFVIALVRALFDSVDVNRRIPRITSNSEQRVHAFKYHLANRYASKYSTNLQEKISFETDAEWIEITSESYYFEFKNRHNKKENKSIYLMIPFKHISHSHVGVDTFNFEVTDWLFLSTASMTKSNLKACKWGWNLTNRTILSPDSQHRIRKSVDLELKTLRNFIEETHIVIRIPMIEFRKKTPPIIYIDMYSRDARQIRIDSVRTAWLPLSVASIIAPSKSVVIKTQPGTLRYYVDITGIPDAVYIKLNDVTDTNIANSPGYATVQIKELCDTSNSIISQLYTFEPKDIGRKRTFQLQTEIGIFPKTKTSEMIISLDPRFRYSIQVGRAGIIDKMSYFAKYRANRLYPAILGILLLIIAARMDDSQHAISISFTTTIVASIIFDISLDIWVALGLLIFLTTMICCSIVFSGTMIHNVSARFLARALARFPASWYNWLIRQSLDQLPIVAIFLFTIFISSNCGALIMVLTTLLYFLKLTCMYEDYLEDLLMSSFRTFINRFRKPNNNNISKHKEPGHPKDSTANIVNHLLLFMVWFLTAGSAIPSTLIWAKNFSYEKRLSTEDPIMLGSWIILSTWNTLGSVKFPINFEYHCYRIDLITMCQRILGWSLLCIAGSNNPAYHQWMIPPVVALFISCHHLRLHCSYYTCYDSRFPPIKKSVDTEVSRVTQ